MDTHSSFGFQEHLSTFELPDLFSHSNESWDTDELSDESILKTWHWDSERELISILGDLPQELQWPTDLALESSTKLTTHNWYNYQEESEKATSLDLINLVDEPLNELPPSVFPPADERPKAIKLGGKKIDMQANCYIVDENDVDVATEIKIESNTLDDDSDDAADSNSDANSECAGSPRNAEIIDDTHGKDRADSESEDVDVDTISVEGENPVLEAGDVNSLLEQFEASETKQPVSNEATISNKITAIVVEERKMGNAVAKAAESLTKNKQIMNALPQELIRRINASSKKKAIPVIDPIPNKRRGTKRSHTEVSVAASSCTQKMHLKFIKLDHNYCTVSTPYPKNAKKDSGFQSAEEEESRNILRAQPTVKRADGKLMVSLLKANTIKSGITQQQQQQQQEQLRTKRKLNLEEYKKRRNGLFPSADNSQSNSPLNSGRNSPIVESEAESMLKHQQKLLQMATAVLKTAPKNKQSNAGESTTSTTPVHDCAQSLPSDDAIPATVITTPPPNIEMKTLVSIGVNTPSSGHAIVEELQPILQVAKIDKTSLITSVIENYQNQLIDDGPKDAGTHTTKEVHGEDKTIVYLDKDRLPVATSDVAVQTDQYKVKLVASERRISISSGGSSCSSCSSSSSHGYSRHRRRRTSSSDSELSSGSPRSYDSGSYSSLRYRVRSPTPPPLPSGLVAPPAQRMYQAATATAKPLIYDREMLRTVEERRIVYVGGIESNITKESLRKRFQRFGPITNVSVHFRGHGENYGFVTFVRNVDAYNAIEHGNDDLNEPQYDISFGGRRIFCRARYSDLDDLHDGDCDVYDAKHMPVPTPQEQSFDNLLQEFLTKLHRRKNSL